MTRRPFTFLVATALSLGAGAAEAQQADPVCLDPAGTRDVLPAPLIGQVPLNVQLVINTAALGAGEELLLLEDSRAGDARINELGPPEGISAPDGLHVAELQGLRPGSEYALVLSRGGDVVSEPLATFTARAAIDAEIPAQPTVALASASVPAFDGCADTVTFDMSRPNDDVPAGLLVDVAVRFLTSDELSAVNEDGTPFTPAIDPARDTVAARVPINGSGPQHVAVTLPQNGVRDFVIQVRVVDSAGHAGPWSEPLRSQSEQFGFCDLDCGDIMVCDAAGAADLYGATGVFVAVLLFRRRRR